MVGGMPLFRLAYPMGTPEHEETFRRELAILTADPAYLESSTTLSPVSPHRIDLQVEFSSNPRTLGADQIVRHRMTDAQTVMEVWDDMRVLAGFTRTPLAGFSRVRPPQGLAPEILPVRSEPELLVTSLAPNEHTVVSPEAPPTWVDSSQIAADLSLFRQEFMADFPPPPEEDPFSRELQRMRAQIMAQEDERVFAALDRVATDFPQPFSVSENVGIAVFNPRAVPREVTLPEFEIASNPTVRLSEIRQRRFDLIDRTPQVETLKIIVYRSRFSRILLEDIAA